MNTGVMFSWFHFTRSPNVYVFINVRMNLPLLSTRGQGARITQACVDTISWHTHSRLTRNVNTTKVHTNHISLVVSRSIDTMIYIVHPLIALSLDGAG